MPRAFPGSASRLPAVACVSVRGNGVTASMRMRVFDDKRPTRLPYNLQNLGAGSSISVAFRNGGHDMVARNNHNQSLGDLVSELQTGIVESRPLRDSTNLTSFATRSLSTEKGSDHMGGFREHQDFNPCY